MKFKSEKGQAMVEFALVLPVILMIFGGIIDFGLVFNQKVLANNASREAARYVAVHYKTDSMTPASATTKAGEKARGNLPPYIVSIPPQVTANVLNGEVTVVVHWETSAFMPVYSKLLDVINITSTTVMKIE